ncbi:MAG: leucyl aminopeptidase, partial [Acidobacteria bacterium]|nr:leucyl aminopeptidase [Acidobacteriota bacterium]
RRRRVGTVAVLLRGDVDSAQAARAAAEGVLLGSHADRRFKSGEDDEPPVGRALVVFPSSASAELARAIAVGSTLGEAANRARELADAPGNALSPRLFAEQAETLAGASGVAVEVLDEAAIERLQMGLLLGVARGSAEPPRLIVMRHEPAGAPREPVLGLIGKGVTFDSGGISIKPADRMEQMKHDMAGGAAVVGAMRAIGRLAVPTRVIGIVPATENMPGGRATRPGDVLTGASGKTVEVINTDAEGRLILGDALWYARELGATHLVDVATLTGAVVIALGHAASGLFGRPHGWVESVQQAAERAGERVWPMPLYPDYDEQLRSETADLGNIGGRAGGACTAAAFLKAFAADLPWAHLDIAGTAWADEASAAQAKGATGAMVRTLTELAVAAGSW